MMGRFLAGVIVIAALFAGVGIYYFQVYGFYDEVAVDGVNDVQITSLATGVPETILYERFEAIDADSSPIRYRACFTTSQSLAMMTETYAPYKKPEPLNAPDWFECFDAAEIGTGLETGDAVAFMGTENIHYGIDRVIAVFPEGRGFVWHQINHCGEVVFDGQPVPEDCPTPPESNQ